MKLILVFGIRPLVTMPVRMLAWLIPKDQNIWVFGCHGGQHFNGNSYYFYQYVRKQAPKHICIVLVTHNPTVANDYPDVAVMAYSLRGLWLVTRAAKAFITNFIEDDINILTISPRLEVINMWHGIPIKSIRWSRPKWQQRMLAIVRFGVPKPSVFVSTYDMPLVHIPEQFAISQEQLLVSGYPRNDRLLESTEQNKPWSDPTINRIWLYAPTFRDTTHRLKPFGAQTQRQIDAFLKERGIYLFVAQHPVARAVEIDNRCRHIRDTGVEGRRIEEWMSRAEVLITDYSSICIDFALTDRPIIFYAYDYDEYAEKVGFCMDYFAELPGPFARTEEEFVSLIRQTDELFGDSAYRDTYDRFKKHFHRYIDANSSKRLYEYVTQGTI